MKSLNNWNLMYVAGNPEIFNRVRSCASNPYKRSNGLEAAKHIIKQYLKI